MCVFVVSYFYLAICSPMVSLLGSAGMTEHSNNPDEGAPVATRIHTRWKDKDSRMREEVNDQRSQESSGLWERR